MSSEFNPPWPMVSLGEILTQYKEYINDLEPRMYPKLSVKLYGKGVVLDEPVNGLNVKMRRHQLAKSDQVILSEIWGKKGAIGFVPPEGAGALCTSHFFLFNVNEDKILPRYLEAIFKGNYLELQLGDKARGTTGYAAVRPKHLLAAQIPLPPLEEQRRIVVRIESLAAKVEAARKLREEAVKEMETMMRSASGNIFEKLKEHCCQSRTLGDVTIRITKGESPRWQGFSYMTEGPLFIRSQNVLWGMLDLSSEKRISLSFHQKLARSQLQSGDVLINLVGASIGRAAVVPDDFGKANVNQAVAVITPSSVLHSRFLMLYLLGSSVQRTLHAGKVETARPNISLTNLRRLIIPLPPLPEQRRIVAYLDALQAKVAAVQQQQAATQARLEALMPAILDQAFRGEL